MPVLRGEGGHPRSRDKLKSGEFPVMDKMDDQSILRCAKGSAQGELDLGNGCLYGDYFVIGWRPWGMVLGTIGFLSFCFSILKFIDAFSSYGSRYDFLVASSFLCVSVGLFVYWITNNRYRKFIVFDRKNSLVHIPRYFDDSWDVVRWNDLNVLIIDESTGYAGLRKCTCVYLAIPGTDLKKKEYPFSPFRRRQLFLTDGGSTEKEIFSYCRRAERFWLFVVDFMSKPVMNSVFGDYSQFSQVVEDKCHGDWDYFFRKYWPPRISWYRKHLLDRFRPELLDREPNWTRHPDGSWDRGLMKG